MVKFVIEKNIVYIYKHFPVQLQFSHIIVHLDD